MKLYRQVPANTVSFEGSTTAKLWTTSAVRLFSHYVATVTKDVNVKRLLGLIVHSSTLLLLVSSASLAQGARSLGMGGVLLPDSAASSYNPAYAAAPLGAHTTLELPLGVFNLIGLARDFDTSSPLGTNVFGLVDQATHLGTLIFRLPQTPTLETIIVDVVLNDDGTPKVKLDLEGTAASVLEFGVTRYGTELAAPINFGGGALRIGVRPYVTVNGFYTPDADLRKLFGEGTTQGGLDFGGAAEAGVALDIIYAGSVPTGDPNVAVYLGFRGAPYLGLFRADTSGNANLAVTGSGLDDVEASYSYELNTFVSTGLGFGIAGDLGVAVTSRDPSGGTFSFGVGLRNLGFGIWNGNENNTSATVALTTSDGETPAQETPVTSETAQVRRTTFSPNFGLVVNGGYQFQAAPFTTVLVAADLGLEKGVFFGHLGGEAMFGLDDVVAIPVRAGLGFENGFVFGLGTGINVSGVSFDIALSFHRAPFNTQQSIGLAASLSF